MALPCSDAWFAATGVVWQELGAMCYSLACMVESMP